MGGILIRNLLRSMMVEVGVELGIRLMFWDFEFVEGLYRFLGRTSSNDDRSTFPKPVSGLVQQALTPC